MVEFRILGGLEAESGGRCVPLGGYREQRVLATLVLAGDVCARLGLPVEEFGPGLRAADASLDPDCRADGGIAAVPGQPASRRGRQALQPVPPFRFKFHLTPGHTSSAIASTRFTRPSRSPSFRTRHFEGSRGGRLISRRHAQTERNRSGYSTSPYTTHVDVNRPAAGRPRGPEPCQGTARSRADGRPEGSTRGHARDLWPIPDFRRTANAVITPCLQDRPSSVRSPTAIWSERGGARLPCGEQVRPRPGHTRR
jgi:hypothetical protein